MTRLTHHERSQNWRALIVSLICLALLLGIAATSNAHAKPADQAAATSTTSSSKALVEIPNTGFRFYYNYVCVRDNSWGSFYPGVIATIVNQLNGPADLQVDVFNAYEYPDICANRFQDRQIVRFGLIPAENSHLYTWCAAGSGGKAGTPINGYTSYAEHIEIYYNYYRAGCRSDLNFIRRHLSRQFGYYFGLKNGNYGPAYTVMNDARDDILWHTANDLYEYNDIY